MRLLNLRILRTLKDAYGQNLAVAMVIAVGLTFYVSMTTAILNLENTVDEYFKLTNAADLFIEMPSVSSREIESLESIQGVSEAQGRIVRDVPVVGMKNEKVNLRMISIPSNAVKEPIYDLYFHEGESIDEFFAEGLFINSFIQARGLKLDDTITLQVGGGKFPIAVKGIVSSSEYIYLMESEQSLFPDFKKFGVVYVDERFAMRTLGMQGTYNQVLIKAEAGTNLKDLKTLIEKRWESKGIQRIYSKEDQLSNRIVKEEIDGNKKTSGTVPLIFLGVAAAIMYAMIARNVQQDRMAIGVLKAMGYTSFEIVSHYCMYAIAIGLVGAIIGVAGGGFLSAFITSMYAEGTFNIPILSFKFYPQFLFGAVLLAVVFSIVAGIIGSKSVVDTDPAVSMRPEAPSAGKRIWLESTRLWRHMTFTEKLIIRNLSRSRRRIISVSLGIGLTYALVLMPLYQYSAFMDMFEFQYGIMQRMDYQLTFTRPVTSKVVTEVRELVSTEGIEGKLEYPFEVWHGNRHKIVSIIGVEDASEFIRFYDAFSGNIIDPGLDDVLITESLARFYRLEVGDEVRVDSFIPGRSDEMLRVSHIIEQNLGGNLYMNLDTMQRRFVEPGLINGLWMDSKDNVKELLGESPNVSTIQSVEDLRNVYKEFLQLMMISIGIMVIFGGILGVAIVYNSVIMAINERRTEFSSMRVLGMEVSEIWQLMIWEMSVIGFLGILMGLPMGYGLIKFIADSFSTDLYVLKPKVMPIHYAVAAGLTMGFILLSLALASRKVKHINFIEALKNRVT